MTGLGAKFCQNDQVRWLNVLPIFLKLLLNKIPIDQGPESLDVIRAPILVIEVIRVFPNIQPKDGGVTFHIRTVLVSGGVDLQLLVAIQNEPCPTRAKAGGGGGSEFFLEHI